MCYQFTGLRYTLRRDEEKGEGDPRQYILSEVWIGGEPLDDDAHYTGVTSAYCLGEDVLSALKIPGVERLPAEPSGGGGGSGPVGEGSDEVASSASASAETWEPAALKDYLLRYVAEHSPLQPLQGWRATKKAPAVHRA